MINVRGVTTPVTPLDTGLPPTFIVAPKWTPTSSARETPLSKHLYLLFFVYFSLKWCFYYFGSSLRYASLIMQCDDCFRFPVVAVGEQVAGSPLRMRDDSAGNDVMEESKRSMGLLRLGRSRWSPSESNKRSMGLLRLGRTDPEATHEDDKRSMQLLRLGRKRNDGEDLVVDSDGQMQHRSVTVSYTHLTLPTNREV